MDLVVSIPLVYLGFRLTNIQERDMSVLQGSYINVMVMVMMMNCICGIVDGRNA